MPVVNTKGVAIGFELAPDGLYKAVFTSYKNKESGDGAMARFTIRAPKKVQLDNGSAWDAEGKTVVKSYSFKDTALWSWKRDMVYGGIDPAQLESSRTDTDKVMDALVGREVMIEVGHHEHEGKTYNDIAIVEEDAFANAQVAQESTTAAVPA